MEKKVIYERGYIHDVIPHRLFRELISNLDIDSIQQKEDYSKNLAGNMEIEKKVTGLIQPRFYEYMSSVANEYYNNFSIGRGVAQKISNVSRKYIFHDTWMNYQRKYEFNPVHQHDGSLSYVVWINIPYELKDELTFQNCANSVSPVNSLFQFIGDNFIHSVEVSNMMEGHIIMFESDLKHVVYPFYTSDEYRISIAGNLDVLIVD